MFNYLRGEIYRVLRKKSLYIYFPCFALCYFLLIFIIRSSDGSANGMLSDAENLFSLLPAVIGGYLFTVLYTDDLNSKNLTTLIGFDMGKARIVISKLILTAFFGGVVFALLPLFMSAVYAVLGLLPTAGILGGVYAYALHTFMITFACTAVSAIVIYGLQRPTFGMVVYLLLSLGVVNQLVTMLIGWDAVKSLLPGLSEHILFGISARVLKGILLGEAVLAPLIEYVIYVTAAAALSVFAFNKKELEF